MEHFMTSVFMSIWEGFKLRAFYYVSILFLIRKRGEEEFRTTRAFCWPSSTRRSNSGFRSITLLDTVTYKQNQDADTDTQSTFLSLHRVIRQGGRRQKFPSELGHHHHHLLLLLCPIANSHFCWRVPISIALNSTTAFTCSSFSDSSSCSQLDHFPSICRKSQDIELEPLQEPKQLKGSPAPGNGQIRYRSPSSADLFEYQGNNSPPSHSADQHLLEFESSKMLKRPGRQESFTEKIYRFRGVLIVVSVPLLLITFVLYLMPASTSNQSIQGYALPHRKIPSDQKFSNSYAVIFDAGSSGSRVHVFHFDHNLDLVHIGKDLELFVQIKPGLSAYAQNPQQAANSLISLLDKAESVVPRELRPKTPVRVGATAGLRALEGDASDKILQAVRNLLKERSTLKSEADAVAVLDGTQEGAFQWVTINYLLGNLGKTYSNTVGVVDLGGGSVQMAYAISDTDAAKAPKLSDGEDPYIKEMFLRGRKYYLYVHSYLGYGLLAARAEILKVFEDSYNPCILSGFDGSYKYGGKLYKASAFPSGSSLNECKSIALKALKVNESTCTHMKCTFGGIWNGGGGDGRKNLFVASFFFDRAAEAGFADRNSPVAKVHPVDFEDAAKRACETKLKDAKATYPHVEEGNLPFICMDLVYQYTLLVDGFGLDPWQEITLVKQVKYQDSLVEAAWPLGSAIEAVSSLT